MTGPEKLVRPMIGGRYSPNWKEIAQAKKRSVGWMCERCGLQCLEPGQGETLSVRERYRRRMAVHHADYNPGNNTPENLMALCSTCHLYYHQRRKGNQLLGQLSIPGMAL